MNISKKTLIMIGGGFAALSVILIIVIVSMMSKGPKKFASEAERQAAILAEQVRGMTEGRVEDAPGNTTKPGGKNPAKLTRDDLIGTWEGTDQDGRSIRIEFDGFNKLYPGSELSRPDSYSKVIGTCTVTGKAISLKGYSYVGDTQKEMRQKDDAWGGAFGGWWCLKDSSYSQWLSRLVIIAPDKNTNGTLTDGAQTHLSVVWERDYDPEHGQDGRIVLFSTGPMNNDHGVTYEGCPEQLGKVEQIRSFHAQPQATYKLRRSGP